MSHLVVLGVAASALSHTWSLGVFRRSIHRQTQDSRLCQAIICTCFLLCSFPRRHSSDILFGASPQVSPSFELSSWHTDSVRLVSIKATTSPQISRSFSAHRILYVFVVHGRRRSCMHQSRNSAPLAAFRPFACTPPSHHCGSLLLRSHLYDGTRKVGWSTSSDNCCRVQSRANPVSVFRSLCILSRITTFILDGITCRWVVSGSASWPAT